MKIRQNIHVRRYCSALRTIATMMLLIASPFALAQVNTNGRVATATRSTSYRTWRF